MINTYIKNILNVSNFIYIIILLLVIIPVYYFYSICYLTPSDNITREHRVRCITFSPDGKFIATGHWDGTVALWDTMTGHSRGEYRRHAGQIEVITFAPDCRTLASGGSDWTVKLWDVPSLQEHSVLRISSQFITSLAFSPDSLTLFSSDFHGTTQGIRRWDVISGEEQTVVFLTDAPGGVCSMALSPDGKLLAYTSDDTNGTIQLQDVASGTKLRLHNTKEFGSLTNIEKIYFTANGRYIVTYGGSSPEQRLLRVWDAFSFEAVRSVGQPGEVNNLASFTISADGSTLVTADLTKETTTSRNLRLWDLTSGRCLGRNLGNSGIHTCVALSPDGKLLAMNTLQAKEPIAIVNVDTFFSVPHSLRR